MCSITVVNKYKVPNNIYCGRGTPVGNPFPMRGEYMRDEVCDKYLVWFIDKLNKPTVEFDKFLDDLVTKAVHGPINLGCFCAPKRCHCDTIKEYIEHRLNRT